MATIVFILGRYTDKRSIRRPKIAHFVPLLRRGVSPTMDVTQLIKAISSYVASLSTYSINVVRKA